MYLSEKIRPDDMAVKIGEKAPNFGVSDWVQGAPTNFDQEKDHIVLLEVFQVNCPGCFMHAIPDNLGKIPKRYLFRKLVGNCWAVSWGH